MVEGTARRGRMPAGASLFVLGFAVVFVVSGTEGCVVPVVVSGRAAVVEVAPDDPTVELRLDVETYTTLGMGRLDPATALADGRVAIVGDDQLGRAVVASMNFMV